MPVSAVQEDAGAGLDELDLDDDDDDADLVVGAVAPVGVSGSAGGLLDGVSVCVSLGASLGVGSVAALPPPSHTPPSSLGS